MTESTKCCD